MQELEGVAISEDDHEVSAYTPGIISGEKTT